MTDHQSRKTMMMVMMMLMVLRGDELDQVKEEKEGEGYDGPPVEEDDDEGKGANAEKGIRKEKWGKPEH